jgi:Ser/Thr protein kinase RdoA (MazF antagonist)
VTACANVIHPSIWQFQTLPWDRASDEVSTIPNEILAVFRSHLASCRLRPLAAGMSGARLFVCQSTDGRNRAVLRRWPRHTPAKRVLEIHHVIAAANKQIEWFPQMLAAADGQTVATDVSGFQWELATWLPGTPLADDASLDQIRAGAVALAWIHRALARTGVIDQRPMAVIERQKRISWLGKMLPQAWEISPDGRVPATLVPTITQAQMLLRARWTAVSATMFDSLRRLERDSPTHYVLRDVHREHLLWRDNRITGVIDFDALRVDTPATDLARWASSFSMFRSDRQTTIDAVLAGYQQGKSFREGRGGSIAVGSSADGVPASQTLDDAVFDRQDRHLRTLVGELADSSIWISLANWVVWLVVESRQFPSHRQVSERIVRLMEAAAGSVER